MTDQHAHPYTIVVGVDFEPDGDRAIDTAIELAEAHGGNASIHLLYVDSELTPRVAGIDAGMAGYRREVDKRREHAFDALDRVSKDRAEALERGGRKLTLEGVTAHFRVGRPPEQIVQLAIDLDADLIVVGTHGRKGVKRVLLGSVAASVLRLARCPVFVVRPKDHEDIGDVPEIEPPCPRCVATRKATAGSEWWCEQHGTQHRPLAHRYHYFESMSRSAPAPWGPSMG
ncbi:MAG TPA: universal stress protein [Polyangiaceae bacterium]|jgi:nucleotide-binding universal stress UspA family protein|nr:universal stress protein [Polyangiaceae bacterium]